jgi:hypothetical protein
MGDCLVLCQNQLLGLPGRIELHTAGQASSGARILGLMEVRLVPAIVLCDFSGRLFWQVSRMGLPEIDRCGGFFAWPENFLDALSNSEPAARLECEGWELGPLIRCDL